jgi:cleavage and polyadenylation specificity factor subunit 1
MSMLYGELTAPTAVTLALTAHLRAPAEQNLIVAKASLLQIFRIRTSVRETQLRTAHAAARSALGDAVAETMLGDDGGEDFMGDDSQVQLLRQEKVGQLVLVEEVQMSGSISGMVNLGPLQNIGGDLDCIAISFLDAKVISL